MSPGVFKLSVRRRIALPSRVVQWSYQCGSRWSSVALLAILMGCKGSRSEPQQTPPSGTGNGAAGNGAVSDGVAQLAPEPERFRFVLPPTYVPKELRGEGSETLLVPPEAQVRSSASGIAVEAGSDFGLEIQLQSTLAALPVAARGAQRAASEKDVVVFKSGAGYWFLVLRELVPEWDENERRRVVCQSAGSSAGSGSAGEPAVAPAEAPQRLFSRAAVERMVAACRSLDLPRLE